MEEEQEMNQHIKSTCNFRNSRKLRNGGENMGETKFGKKGIYHSVELSGTLFTKKKIDNNKNGIADLTKEVITYIFEDNGYLVDIKNFEKIDEPNLSSNNEYQVEIRIKSIDLKDTTILNVAKILELLSCDYIGDLTTIEIGNRFRRN